MNETLTEGNKTKRTIRFECYDKALKTAMVHGQTCTRTRITAESAKKPKMLYN